MPAAAKTARRRPAILQADVARAIRAAKQTGAAEVEVRIGAARILVRIAPSTAPSGPIETQEEIVL